MFAYDLMFRRLYKMKEEEEEYTHFCGGTRAMADVENYQGFGMPSPSKCVAAVECTHTRTRTQFSQLLLEVSMVKI